MAKTTPAPIIEKLTKRHDRAAFDCGVDELNVYLQRFAGQNERAGLSQHYVAVQAGAPNAVLGYYALSAGAVDFELLDQDQRKRLPRYPVPVAHLGRLAVDRSAQGRRLGEMLLIDALARTVRVADEVGMHAVEVVAINDAARKFYLKYGFTALRDDVNHLYLPIRTVKKLDLA
ncbi:MAG: GNAT family N-acetyltransferase [Planctomycetota bacterium]